VQIAAGDALAVTFGNGLTVTLTVAVPVHPKIVPVTEYVVVFAGETVMLEPVPPVLHAYVLAPLTFNDELCPLQIVAGVALMDNVALSLTVTDTDAVPVHPKLVPVTVYVIVFTGLTEILEPLPPVLHEYVPAPPAVNIAL
jgi:hypothetical protein